jgi:hypothetical protein
MPFKCNLALVGQGENLWDLSHVIGNFVLESFDVEVFED